MADRTSGVGDDLGSYALDGYRIVAWNKTNKDYGTFWDVGDVIGICIDLENKCIEYFINGVSQGIAFKNIEVGPNIAYFPSLTLSKKERCLINTGQFKFAFSDKYISPNNE